jgi:CheY-specific phosphatase CheX
MKDSISEVFETMFFLPLDFDENTSPKEQKERINEEMLAVKLAFKGPLSGYFIFIIPKKLTLSLTAGFLGEDLADTTLDKIHGTVKEMLNMVAGNLFSRLDSKAVFDLGIPNIIPEQEAWTEMLQGKNSVLISMNTTNSPMFLQTVYKA